METFTEKKLRANDSAAEAAWPGLEPLAKAAQREGFTVLRNVSATNAVFERGGLRLRLTAESGIYGVEGLYQRQNNLAEFLLENTGPQWWTGLRSTLIVRRLETTDLEKAVIAVRELGETSALLAPLSDNNPAFQSLRQLGVATWRHTVPEPWKQIGRELLRQTRALGVQGDMQNLQAWLSAFLPTGCRFAFREEMLLADPAKLGLLIRESPGNLNRVAVAVDLGVLPNDAWKYLYAQFAAELNHADPAAGARFLFLLPPGAAFPKTLPVVDLPDFTAQEIAAGSRKRNPLSGVLTRGGTLDSREAEDLLRVAQRSTELGNEHGTTTLADTRPSGTPSPDRLRERRRLLLRGLSEQIIGHPEILSQLARSIALWMAGMDDQPLVLAFAGPSGVGKNLICMELAKILAKPAFFNLPSARYFAINLAMEQDGKYWGLTGVGAGHVGAERKGLLESATASDGYVLSLDELDKQVGGHSDPQGFLVNILEQGGFRNGHGQQVRFGRGIIVLTLNCGMNASDERWSAIGFATAGVEDARQQWMLQHYQEYYQRNLIAPLRGRISASVFFGELTAADRFALAHRECGLLRAETVALGLTWPQEWDDLHALAATLARTADPAAGARGIRKTIREFRDLHLEQLLGDFAQDIPNNT